MDPIHWVAICISHKVTSFNQITVHGRKAMQLLHKSCPNNRASLVEDHLSHGAMTMAVAVTWLAPCNQRGKSIGHTDTIHLCGWWFLGPNWFGGMRCRVQSFWQLPCTYSCMLRTGLRTPWCVTFYVFSLLEGRRNLSLFFLSHLIPFHVFFLMVLAGQYVLTCYFKKTHYYKHSSTCLLRWNRFAWVGKGVGMGLST